MRAEPTNSAEMISQSILGTPMKLVAQEGEWMKLEGPDGYTGYVNQSSVTPLTKEELIRWQKSPRLRVSSIDEAIVYIIPTKNTTRNTVTSLVNGCVVVDKTDGVGEFMHISLPDGREGYIERGNVKSLDSIPPFSAEKLLDDCYMLMGTPYLWGGCSTKSMDCSGLVRIAYLNQGLLIPRDAKDQFKTGLPIEDGLKRGDLLFFSSSSTGNITHVAIYDSDNRYIHCSGMVKTSKMSTKDPDFSKRYFVGARRINPDSISGEVVRLIDHPWYF